MRNARRLDQKTQAQKRAFLDYSSIESIRTAFATGISGLCGDGAAYACSCLVALSSWLRLSTHTRAEVVENGLFLFINKYLILTQVVFESLSLL